MRVDFNFVSVEHDTLSNRVEAVGRGCGCCESGEVLSSGDLLELIKEIEEKVKILKDIYSEITK